LRGRMNFAQVWFTGYVSPGRFVAALQSKPALIGASARKSYAVSLMRCCYTFRLLFWGDNLQPRLISPSFPQKHTIVR
jgi:hypothetical protein